MPSRLGGERSSGGRKKSTRSRASIFLSKFASPFAGDVSSVRGRIVEAPGSSEPLNTGCRVLYSRSAEGRIVKSGGKVTTRWSNRKIGLRVWLGLALASIASFRLRLA